MTITLPHPREQEMLIGHQEAEQWLLNAKKEGKLPHSLIISGPRGIGKATLAYRLLKSIAAEGMHAGQSNETLLRDPKHPKAEKVARGAFSDLWVIGDVPEKDNIKEISVEQIREMNHFLSMTPAESPHRMILIDDADMMNRNAANALLKTLEEPPSHAIIILISHTPGKLLPTIRSRCQQLKLSTLSRKQMQEWYQEMDIPGKSGELIYGLASGSPGQLLRFMDWEVEATYGELLEYLASLPKLNAATKLKLAEKYGSAEAEETWQGLSYCLLDIVSRSVRASAEGSTSDYCYFSSDDQQYEKQVLQYFSRHYSIERLALLWEKMSTLLGEGKQFHMSRKQQFLELNRLIEAA